MQAHEDVQPGAGSWSMGDAGVPEGVHALRCDQLTRPDRMEWEISTHVADSLREKQPTLMPA